MTFGLRVFVALSVWLGSSTLACRPTQRTTPSLLTDQHPTTPSAQSRLDEVIRNANRSMQGDKITLLFPPNSAVTTGDTSTASPQPVIIRANMGDTASFVCETSSANASDTLTWTHQGHTLVRVENLPPNSNHFDIVYHGRVSTLSIINVSFASSGEVACYETWNGTTTVLKRYNLHPNVRRAADVFSVPMPNWSIEKGGREVLLCKVRFTLSAQMMEMANELCMWRHNNRTVVAPTKAPYGPLGPLRTPNKEIYVVNTYTYESAASIITFRMKLIRVDRDDSGSVECWFRESPDVDEWFIQSASLDVR